MMSATPEANAASSSSLPARSIEEAHATVPSIAVPYVAAGDRRFRRADRQARACAEAPTRHRPSCRSGSSEECRPAWAGGLLPALLRARLALDDAAFRRALDRGRRD